MVYGRGKPGGPDLSNIGRERTADVIRTALLQPSSQITPGYDLVTVRLRSGKTIRGFARGRSKFDIRLQDMEGNFHLLDNSQISSVQDEKQSAMPPPNATPAELHEVMVYLGHLTGPKPGVPVAPGTDESGGIDFSRSWIPNREIG
jgi:putative heme-binding domain-containing protein